jgi:hypothetical protein
MNKYKNNILQPSAKIQFENTPSLFFKYKGIYDNYVDDNYRYNKPKWSNALSYVNHTESKTSDIDVNETSIVLDDAPINLVNDLIEKNTESYSKSNSINNQSNEEEINVKKIKSKNPKPTNNYRNLINTCPYCLSKLVTNEFNILECSGDKIKIWEKTFIDYEKMNDKDRKEFIKKFSDISMFNELYERWSYKDEKGMRQGLSCIFTSRLFNPISRIRSTLYDPILVGAIERSLGRSLSDKELSGEVEIWKEKNSYFSDYKKGRKLVRVPELIFPDNFI